MSLFVTSLNSGSNANCYYIGNETEAVLIDAGLSCRETELRMKRLGLSMQLVRAVFISHEHSDHIRGLAVLAKKHQMPVYITPATLQHAGLNPRYMQLASFQAHHPVQIGNLQITAFPKFHDAADPHSFIIQDDDVTVGVFTDIGTICEQVIRYFQQCHAVFLESNYDTDMLDKGNYPYYLKRRIKGGHGHLSNAHALQLFTTYRPTHLSHVFLSHLSKNNNSPTLVRDLFTAHANGAEIVVASRYEETALYQLSGLEHLSQVRGLYA
jgi:phosphoribosyl 1,2-cyclic phosphodiesterase